MKSVVISGSTGSIGVQAIEVCKKCGFKVVALSAHKNYKLLAEQARLMQVQSVCISDERFYSDLKALLSDTDIKVLAGEQALCEMISSTKADVLLNAIVGISGLAPTVAAIKSRKDIALANKETLVAGGEYVMSLAKECGVSILPVDSEHSAIFQSLVGCADLKEIKKLIITASGGPFFGKSREELASVTLADALKHPNWVMGQKITIDSATLMNKGLEFIEAVFLFSVDPKNIEIVVHRESVIHSLVEFVDNSVIAQLGVPNMEIPIQYALTYPNRYESNVRPLSLTEYGTLTFYKPDFESFKAPTAAIEAIKEGGLKPAIVNGANEKAVELFLAGKISFLDIERLILKSLDLKGGSYKSIDEVFEADRYAREFVMQSI